MTGNPVVWDRWQSLRWQEFSYHCLVLCRSNVWQNGIFLGKVSGSYPAARIVWSCMYCRAVSLVMPAVIECPMPVHTSPVILSSLAPSASFLESRVYSVLQSCTALRTMDKCYIQKAARHFNKAGIHMSASGKAEWRPVYSTPWVAQLLKCLEWEVSHFQYCCIIRKISCAEL